MTRNFSRPRMVRASSVRRAARKAETQGVKAPTVEQVAVAVAEQAAMDAPTIHETYAAYVASGHTQVETAKHFGVSRQVIHQAVHRVEYLRGLRDKYGATKAKGGDDVGTTGARIVTCSGCGGNGHHVDSPLCAKRKR